MNSGGHQGGPGGSQHPLPAAINAAAAALAAVADAPAWSLSGPDVTAAIADTQRLVNQAHGLLVRLLGEAAERDIPRHDGAHSLTGWLRDTLRLTPAEAAKTARLVAVTTRGPLTRTGAALTTGAVTLDQACAVADAVANLSSAVPAAAKQQAEQILLGETDRLDPTVLRRLGARVAERVDPDGTDARDGAVVLAAEQRALRDRFLTLRDDGRGAVQVHGRFDAVAAETITQAIAPFTAPRTGDDEPADRRTPGQRRADALVQVCQRALADPDRPAVGGDRPQVVITVDFDKLREQVGVGVLPDGTPVTVATIRRLACEAEVIPMVLGTDGVPLDVGRTARTVTGHLRKAVIARDHGCAFPGCDRPATWCQVHHIRHWADGGPTALSNAVLVCPHHHKLVERGTWQVRLNTRDGHPEFIPPAWIDPTRTPRRNQLHRRQ